jgi:pantoate--beta-alanine ligase
LHQALATARGRIEAGERDADVVRRGMAEQIAAVPGAVLDYAAVVDAETLQPLTQIEVDRTVLLAVAVKFGSTRLIDNVLIRQPRAPARG